ncbi:MAG TPA: nucleotidyltransferase domain-containing protein [Ktedonobacterales bacterium]
MPPDLPNGLLAALVAELDGPSVTGIALGGSYARGDANPFSDVDLAAFVPDGRPVPAKRLIVRDGYLVSISWKTCAAWREGLSHPERAILLAPSARALRILLDRDGSLARLVEAGRRFEWAPLQAEADRFASQLLALTAEHARKTLAALVARDELALSTALASMASHSVLAVATQRGIMITSENTLARQVIESVGESSLWAHALRLALGATGTPGLLAARGQAALGLYGETAALLREVLRADDLPAITATTRLIAASYPA